MSENTGHRKRLKDKFKKSCFAGFNDYEILELLLFYSIPYRDTKPVAKRLIKQFGSLSKVIDADIDELKNIKGMGESTSLFLNLLRELMKKYSTDKITIDKKSLTKMTKLIEYLQIQLGNKKNEVLFVILFNAKNEILATMQLCEGTVTRTAVFPRKIVEKALKKRATSIIIAHNHPDGVAEPSDDDVKITQEIKNALALVEISLQDHIIISDKDYYSFNRSGML